MDNRELFLNNILGRPVPRNCYYLYWPPWKSTMARWIRENGFSKYDYTDELIFQKKEIYPIFDPDIPPQALDLNCGPFPVRRNKVIDEDSEYITFIDNWGVKKRDFKNRESMSEFIEFPVKDEKDWERFKSERLDPDHPGRMAGRWEKQGLEMMGKGFPIQVGGYPDVGVFGAYRWLMGDEEGLIALNTKPGLAADIMDHLTTLYLYVLEKVVKKVRVDVFHLFEDFACRQGPLFSPDHFRKFLLPNYKRIKDFSLKHDIPILSLDSDGDFLPFMPLFKEAGIDLLSPLEVAAGMDINKLCASYPDMGFMGGIDKRVLSRQRKDIDRELDRISDAVRKNRYIPFLDHLVPDDVSWDNYKYYAVRLKEMIFSGRK